MVVAQDTVRVEHSSRQPDGSWVLREYSTLSDVVRVVSIAAEIGLNAIYDGVAFETQP
jgi:hypothetical protein